MTLAEFIEECKKLKPSLQDKPIFFQTPNGMLVDPHVAILRGEHETTFDEPKKLIITYKH